MAVPRDAPKSTFPDFDAGSPDKIAPYHSALERNEAVLKAYAPALKILREGFAFDAFVIATLHVLQFGSANPVVKHDAICGAESHRTRA